MSKWIVPYSKLDNQQRDFIDNRMYKSNTWISGFPGSGKSVLLAHSMKMISEGERDARMVLVVFTHSLIEMFRNALNEMGVRGVRVETIYEFSGNDKANYDYIFADEIQDFPGFIVTEMHNRAKVAVIASGDSNQSIYTTDPKYNKSTVSPDEITRLLNAREFGLNTVHRLTRSLMNSVARLMPKMGQLFSAKNDATKSDVTVRIGCASSEDQEVRKVMDEATQYLNANKSVAILFDGHFRIKKFCEAVFEQKGITANLADIGFNQYGQHNYGRVNKFMEENGINLQYVGNGYGDFGFSGKIVLMTYHGSKGIDFDCVFLPFMNNKMCASSDSDINKTVFMVAITRSKENLFVSYTGKPHPFLSCFKGDDSTWDMSDNGNADDEVIDWG